MKCSCASQKRKLLDITELYCNSYLQQKQYVCNGYHTWPRPKSSHIFISGGHIWPQPDMTAGHEAGFDHILTRLPHCQFAHKFSFFTNSAICTSLGHHGYVDHTHSLVSILKRCSLLFVSLLATYLSYVT